MKIADYQVNEILKEVSQKENRAQKVLELSKFSSHEPLRYILMWNYSKAVRSLLPEGTPPFNQEKLDGPSMASLWEYLKVMPNFVHSDPGLRLKDIQRERIFVEMLEAIDIAEANTVCLAKDGNLEEVYDISVSIVLEALPNVPIVVEEKIPEPTNAEKAEKLVELAKLKRAEAKELQADARDLEKQAKEIKAAE